MRHYLIIALIVAALGQTSLAQGPFQALDGSARTMEQLTDPGTAQAAVLVVWCSRCGSCRGAETELIELSREWGSRVKVVAVDPHPADGTEAIRRYLDGHQMSLDVVRDPSQSLLKAFAIDRTTTTLVFDGQQKLRYFGPLYGESAGYAADAVRALLDKKRVPVANRNLNGCPIPPP